MLTQQNYVLTTHESLSVTWSLRHFRELILGYKVHVLTDHYPVTEIFKVQHLTGKFARWQLTIQESNLKFCFILGNVNAVADSLLRNIAPVFLITDELTMPTAENFKTHQRLDPLCASHLYYLDSGDPSNLPKLHVNVDLFFLQDDLL